MNNILRIELRWLFGCGVVSGIAAVFTCYVPPGPTVRVGDIVYAAVFGAIPVYLFILVCRLIAKGVVRLFTKK